jgi:hypothetical protein
MLQLLKLKNQTQCANGNVQGLSGSVARVLVTVISTYGVEGIQEATNFCIQMHHHNSSSSVPLL